MKDILTIRKELSQLITNYNNDLTNDNVIKEALRAEELLEQIKNN